MVLFIIIEGIYNNMKGGSLNKNKKYNISSSSNYSRRLNMHWFICFIWSMAQF